MTSAWNVASVTSTTCSPGAGASAARAAASDRALIAARSTAPASAADKAGLGCCCWAEPPGRMPPVFQMLAPVDAPTTWEIEGRAYASNLRQPESHDVTCSIRGDDMGRRG